jgi:hypothetical protein
MKFFRWSKPAASPRHIEGHLDSVNVVPSSNESNEIVIWGWALDEREHIQALHVIINKGLPTEMRETAQYGLPRADVRSALPHLPHASNCGFRVLFRAPGFTPEDIKKIEGTIVVPSGETLTRQFEIPVPKSKEDRLAAVALPSEDGKLFGFLDNVAPCYTGNGQTGLVARGWIVHAEKPIVGLTFTAHHEGRTAFSDEVKYGIDHPDLVELLRNILPGGRAAFRAVFESGDFKVDEGVSLVACVTLDGGYTFNTAFPAAIIPKTMTTLVEGVCLPMSRPDNHFDPSDFCFGNLASIQKVWLGKRRVGYYVAGWLMAPGMQISDVWLQAGGRNCEIFHFGYPQHCLETSYQKEIGSKGWFSGLLQSDDWHATELTCRIVGRKENGEEFFSDFPSRPVDCGSYHPRSDEPYAGFRKAVGIYQCFYRDQYKERLDPGFIPYFNDRISRFFENDVIVALVDEKKHSASDYFGVFSWRFSEKIPLRSEVIFDLMAEDGYEADVYTFFEGTHRGLGEVGYNTWTYGECSHPGLIEAGEALMNRLGIRVDFRHLPAPIIYQNHFICRSELYERYVRELLAPAIQTMNDVTDRDIQDLVGRDAQYIARSDTAAQVFGRPYFSLEPFICERLFSVWAALQSLEVRHIFCAKIPGS